MLTDEELIARLRRNGQRIDHGINELCDDAADRIEALTKERDEAEALQSCGCSYDTPTDVCLGHHRLFERLYAVQRGKLEAKLAKAVEALEEIAGNGNAAGRNPQLMADKARATLAEIKGESHD